MFSKKSKRGKRKEKLRNNNRSQNKKQINEQRTSFSSRYNCNSKFKFEKRELNKTNKTNN